VVRDHNGQRLAKVYFEDERGSLRIPIYALVARKADFKSPRSLFCRTLKLPTPIIVGSGWGLHHPEANRF